MLDMKAGYICLAACVALAAGLSLAQEQRAGVAQLKDVHGNVLLGREAGLGAGSEAARLVEGTRVITTANSEVVVVYDNGCEVRLKENQRFQVEVGKPCAALFAESILVEPAGIAAVATAPAAFWSFVPVIGGAAIGLEILKDNREKNPVSPS